MCALFKSNLVLVVCWLLEKHSTEAAHYKYFGRIFPGQMYDELCAISNISRPETLCNNTVDIDNSCFWLSRMLHLSYYLCVPVTVTDKEFKNHATTRFDVCGFTNTTSDYQTAMDQWYWVTGDKIWYNSGVDERFQCLNGLSVFSTTKNYTGGTTYNGTTPPPAVYTDKPSPTNHI